MKRILGVLLTIAMLIGIFPTASFATGTNTQQNETVTYSIFDAIIPFSNMVDCQRTTYTAKDTMQQLNRFNYVYSANANLQISNLVSDVVINPDDYYYRFSEEVDGGITLTMYKYADSTYSYELSKNGYVQTYGDNCFLYVAGRYGTFVSFRDKEYHMCGDCTHTKNYPHENEGSLDSSRKACILCGCGETFIIRGYEPSIEELKALPITEGLVEIDHTHGYDETGKCPCGKYDNKTEIDKSDAGIYSGVVVEGLDDALEDNALEDGSVSVLLKVSEDTYATAEKDAITQIANGQEIDFIELSLLKSVNRGSLQDIGSQNDNLLKIKIPYDTTGKQNISVYRYHESAAEKLSTTANADGEYFEVIAGYVILYAKKFSTYAIGYTNESSYVTPYDLYVGGVQVTSDNTTIDSTDDADITNGSATFDPNTNTLTLDNFVYNGKGSLASESIFGDIYNAAIVANENLNIVLKGTNSIDANQGDDSTIRSCYDIYAIKDINISDADGNTSADMLTISATSYAIYSKEGNLTVKDTKINVQKSADALFSYNGSVTVDNAEISMTDVGNGFNAETTLDVLNNSVINITARSNALYLYNGTVTIENSKFISNKGFQGPPANINIKNSTVEVSDLRGTNEILITDNSTVTCGSVYETGSLDIENSELNTSENGYISVGGDINISTSDVNCKGFIESVEYDFDFETEELKIIVHDITITDSNITVTTTEDAAITGNVTIKGDSTVTSTGATSAFSTAPILDGIYKVSAGNNDLAGNLGLP